jgi:glucosamine kinase
MAQKISPADASYFLGFDGGGTKTECVLADDEGHILAKASAGPSNPVRVGYTRSWFALSDAGDAVLSRQKIHAEHIRAVCAGLGGAGRVDVSHRVATFFERGYPNAVVQVTTDLEIALQSAFGDGEGVVLVMGTGSAALGRDAAGRRSRAGGRGPWISDEGSAFDIGRQAFRAVVRAEESRGPETEIASRLFLWHHCAGWDALYDRITKDAGDVFPRTFPLVAELADWGDEVSCGILAGAAKSLAELVESVAGNLEWRGREVPVARVGGMVGRSKYFDAALESELKRLVPLARLLQAKISPAEAAVQMATLILQSKENVLRT